MRLIDADDLHVDYLFPSTTTMTKCYEYVSKAQINNAPTIEAVPKWIPIKVRPMTEEDQLHFEEHFGYQLDDDDAVYFDCEMPMDRQRIWVTTKCGYVFDDVCESDDGYLGLEGNGDWSDITAWMPMFIPEPYKERTDE